MSKQEDLNRLWDKMREIDRAINAELKECKRRGEVTQAYLNLKADLSKIKDEYEKLKGGGTHNPLSFSSGDAMTTRKVLGDMLGRTGPETHHKLED